MMRHSIGIDITKEYFDMIKKQIKPSEIYLLEPKNLYAKTKSKKRYAVR